MLNCWLHSILFWTFAYMKVTDLCILFTEQQAMLFISNTYITAGKEHLGKNVQIKQLEGVHESAYLRQALAFNAKKFRGSRDPSHAPFWKNFGGSYPDCPWKHFCQTLSWNFKSVALTVFELLAFNTQTFRGSRDPSHAPFWTNFLRSCPDCPWEHFCQISSPQL